MNLTLTGSVLWGLAAAVLAWWWRRHARRRQALEASRRYCQQMNVQLLDETVVLKRLWPQRSAHGSLILRRAYEFEFTATGDDRYPGMVIMLGIRLDSVQLAPHRIQ